MGRDRQPLTRLERLAGAQELGRKLERVEGIASRGCSELTDHGPEKPRAQSRAHELGERVGGERTDAQPVRLREGHTVAVVRTRGGEETNRGAGQAPQREVKRACRRSVEPLRVVDGDHEWYLARDTAQQFHDGVSALGVQGRGGLVTDQQPRVVDQGAGDGHALLLAAGQLVGLVLEPLAHAQLGQ